jgi:hypothetical protein
MGRVDTKTARAKVNAIMNKHAGGLPSVMMDAYGWTCLEATTAGRRCSPYLQ